MINSTDRILRLAPEYAEDPPSAPGSRPVLLCGLLSGAAVVVLDFFIVLACLPTIEQSLRATPAQLQLVMAAYAIANGACLVVGGRLGDVFGRRRMFMLGALLFAMTSIACGLSTSAAALIAFRAAQGVAGAMLQPQVLAMLSVNFAADRAKVFGLYAAALGFAGIVAVMLGGAIVGAMPVNWGWRTCFLISVPICAMAALLSRSAQDGVHPRSRRIDWIGAVLLGGALGCLCTVLSIGREVGFTRVTWTVLAGAAIFAAAFVWWQARARRIGAEPLIALEMLARNRFWLTLVLMLFFYGGVASFYFVLALDLRHSLGFAPPQVGLIFSWLGICFVAASFSQRLKDLLAARALPAGIVVLALGHIVMGLAVISVTGPLRVVAILLSSAMQGVGLGLLMGPLMANAINRVRQEEASVGSGIAAATQQVGNSLGLCLIGFAYFGGDDAFTHGLAAAVVYLLMLLALLALLLRSDAKTVPPEARARPASQHPR